MVDWDQVEKLRGKGWDWTRIAADDRVEFQADSAGGDAGRQLRTLYYQRRSKAQRRGSSGKEAADDSKADGDGTRAPGLVRFGVIAVLLVGIFTAFVFALPSIVAAPFHLAWYEPLIALIVLAGILIFSLFRVSVPLQAAAFKTPVAIGVVLGLIFSGGAVLVGTFEHCPALTSTASANEQQDWARYGNPTWTDNGAPVLFFFGSIACPYCSASSWSLFYALRQEGTLTGYTLAASNPGDVYPNTPEIDLSSATEVSPYVAFQPFEGTNDNQVTTPNLPSCQTQAYVTTYDSTGTIPFVVLGGIYVHSGQSLVNPQNLVNGSAPYSAQEMVNQLDSQTGAGWAAISPQAFLIEAMLLKLNNGQGPSAVTSNPNVMSDYNGLT